MNFAERNRLLRTFIATTLGHLDQAPNLVASVRVQFYKLISDTHWQPLGAEEQLKLSDLIEDAICLYQEGGISADDAAAMILIAASQDDPEL